MTLPTIVNVLDNGCAVVRRRHVCGPNTWYMHWPVRRSVWAG